MGTSSYDDDAYIPGEGWVLFAGTMLALLGGMNLVYGIAAVSNSCSSSLTRGSSSAISTPGAG